MKPATLRILLAWLDVLVAQVDAFDQKHLFLVVDRQDLALNAFVFATDNLNCIAVMNLHFSRHISLFGIEEFPASARKCQDINVLATNGLAQFSVFWPSWQ